jgi:conjugative transfer signal peptidase TraF
VIDDGQFVDHDATNIRHSCNTRMARVAMLALVIGVGCAIGALMSDVLSLYINVTPSIPLGLYRATQAKPRRGTIVLACVPRSVAVWAKRREYIPPGGCPGGVMPLGKIVAGIPGDTIVVSARGALVNEQRLVNSQPLERDRRGRPLPHYPFGTYVLGAREYWLESAHPRSFASRYIGPVPAADLITTVTPLWVRGNSWGEGTELGSGTGGT